MLDFPSQRLLFFETYETASLIEAAASTSSSFIEIPWEEKKVNRIICNFSKKSVLHFFIYAILSTETRRDVRKNPEEYWGEEKHYKEIFRKYGVPFKPFTGRVRARLLRDVCEYEDFEIWFRYQEHAFESLWEKITEEVFHLLFANRSFLLSFSSSLAEFIRDGGAQIPEEFKNTSGLIKRSSIPIWVKRAIFYRDRGRCVLCLKDLSGLLSTDPKLHYDHLVPLKLFGVNDPCNLQLLCDKCNLKKKAKPAITGNRYSPWW